MAHTIYIVLTKTGTLLSKAIGMYTGREMNHASIAFDEGLYEMFSFGRRQLNNPLSGGFLREDAERGLFESADCVIYRCRISHYQYLEMAFWCDDAEGSKKRTRLFLFPVCSHAIKSWRFKDLPKSSINDTSLPSSITILRASICWETGRLFTCCT